MALNYIQNMIELVQLLDHDHDLLSNSCSRKSKLDKFLVLETIEYEQAVAWLFERQGEREGVEPFKGFPHLKRWLAAMRARPAVRRGMQVRVEAASQVDVADPKVRAVLFGRRAR